MKMLRCIIVSITIMSFTSCVTYLQQIDTASHNVQHKMIGDYKFKGTFSFDFELSSMVDEKLNQPISDELREKLKSVKRMKTPTYNELGKYVKSVWGEEATFANVVWDHRRINFIGLVCIKKISVSFDVYQPK